MKENKKPDLPIHVTLLFTEEMVGDLKEFEGILGIYGATGTIEDDIITVVFKSNNGLKLILASTDFKYIANRANESKIFELKRNDLL